MDSFLTLHTLRCIGFAGIERLSMVAGLDQSHIESDLRSLRESGLVEHLDGPFGGWGITDVGKAEDLRLAAAEAGHVRGRIEEAFRRFLDLNPRLLELCTDWQMVKVGGTVVMNDHSDTEYDAAVIDRLIRLDRSAQAVIADLASQLARFDRYQVRLSAALDRVLAGDRSAFADDLESYHTVWFQLHEDLLVTLGLVRGQPPV